MYKRPNKNGFQYKESKSKMRKLDVSVSGAGSSNGPTTTSSLIRPSTSKACLANVNLHSASSSNTNKSVVHQPQKANVPQSPPKNENEYLWADADDEFILAASQMVDNMDMDAINQQIIVQSENMSQNNVIAPKLQDDILKEIFHATEDDDRLFSEINNFDNIGNDMNLTSKTPHPNNQFGERPASPSVFKVPTEVRQEKRIFTSTQIEMNFSFRPETHPQSTQFSQPKSIEPNGMCGLWYTQTF